MARIDRDAAINAGSGTGLRCYARTPRMEHRSQEVNNFRPYQ